MSGTSGKGSTETGTCYYEPFGEVRPGTTCSVPTVYRFAGMEWDGEIGGHGLYHTWFRQYDPSQGRWMGVDALAGEPGDPQSLNRYLYVGNDPVNFLDRLGLCKDWWTDEDGTLHCKDDPWPGPVSPVPPGQCVDVFFDGIPIGQVCNRGGNTTYRGVDLLQQPRPEPEKPPHEPDNQQKNLSDCIAKRMTDSDRERAEYMGSRATGRRVVRRMVRGAVVHGTRVAIAGGVGGLALANLPGGVAGAVGGAFIGGTIGAASAAISSIVLEPLSKWRYDTFTYKPTLREAFAECSKEVLFAPPTSPN